jgi:nitrogen fixation/metabolism regulation signal transduction histidine kinase
LFIRKVAVPIQGVAHAASEIARGNLAVSVPSAIRHEVGDLGQFVNDMAANFQEVLLLTGTTVGNATGSLERIEDLLKSEANPEPKAQLQEHVNSVKRDVESLGSVLKSFKFYQTSFNGREVKHAHPDERSHR